MSGGQVVVLGSIVLDVVMQPATLPAPGETVLSEGYSLYPGGKGANQAVACARAGGDVTFAGAVGRDKFAGLATKGMHDAGIKMHKVKQAHAPTAVACVIVSSTDGENQICVGSGANLQVQASQLEAADGGDSPLKGAAVLLMQMEIPAEENWKAVRMAKESHPGVKTVLNVAPFAGVPEDVVALLGYLIVNELEAQAMCKSYGGGDLAPREAAQWLAKKYKTTVVATLGAEGAVAFAPQGDTGIQVMQVSSLKVEVKDTVGAGDSFVGNFCAALAAGKPLDECMRCGAVGGSLACTELGAQSASPTAAAGAPPATPATAPFHSPLSSHSAHSRPPPPLPVRPLQHPPQRPFPRPSPPNFTGFEF